MLKKNEEGSRDAKVRKALKPLMPQIEADVKETKERSEGVKRRYEE